MLSKKPLMIFLPGKMCDIRVWQYQIDVLSSIVRPLFIDLRKYKTLDDMLLAISMSTIEPFILAGFSMGGYVAQEFILQYRERVSALILAGCSAKGFTKDEKQSYSDLVNLVKKKQFSVMTGSNLRYYLSDKYYNNHDLVKSIEDMVNDAGDQVFINQQSATLNRVCRYEELKSITCPSIVIGGVEDKLVNPQDIIQTASSIPNASHVLFDDCGHMIPLEQPERFTQTIYEFVVDVIKLKPRKSS